MTYKLRLKLLNDIGSAQWKFHCVKSVRIWSFSGPYFPAFRPEKLQIRTLFRQCSFNDLMIQDKRFFRRSHAILTLLSYYKIMVKRDLKGTLMQI